MTFPQSHSKLGKSKHSSAYIAGLLNTQDINPLVGGRESSECL